MRLPPFFNEKRAVAHHFGSEKTLFRCILTPHAYAYIYYIICFELPFLSKIPAKPLFLSVKWICLLKTLSRFPARLPSIAQLGDSWGSHPYLYFVRSLALILHITFLIFRV